MSEKQNSINEKRNQVNQSYHFGGFYDREVKRVCESCPRLMVKAINSLFKKNHSEETEVKYLTLSEKSPASKAVGRDFSASVGVQTPTDEPRSGFKVMSK
jgi:hypothetical protein